MTTSRPRRSSHFSRSGHVRALGAALTLATASCGDVAPDTHGADGSGAHDAATADARPGQDAQAPLDATGSDAAPARDVAVATDAPVATDVATPADGGGTAAHLAAPPDDAITAAIADSFIRYARDLPGGAYTNPGGNGGASIILAAASYAGVTRADARLLAQIRYTITGGNDICANGGYPAQHELFMTGAFALVRHTPRVWDALTATEHAKIDALMEASLIGSAFTTSDANPFIHAGTQEYTLDADSNLGRDWNPNYRDGMQGSVLTAAGYFGLAATQAMLRSYAHAPFVATLASLGLTNAHLTFNWKTANPSSSAPTAAQIEAAVHAYAYHGHTLADVMGYYQQLTDYTYGGTVACGANGGPGVRLPGGGYSGVIVAGCAGLPHPGATGMELEFNSRDAEGVRSAAYYVYDGYKGNLITELAMVATGLWQPGAAASEVTARQQVGITDFWYKLDQGYHDYAHGADNGISRSTDTDSGYVYMRPLWASVVAPYFGL